MSGRGDRGASRGVKCQAGWHMKGQSQGDLQTAFVQDDGVSLSCQHGVIKPKLCAAKCTYAPRDRTAGCRAQLLPSHPVGAVAVLARGCPSAGAALCSPSKHPGVGLGWERVGATFAV